MKAELQNQIKFSEAFKNNSRLLKVYNKNSREYDYRFAHFKNQRMNPTISGKAAFWLELIAEERGQKPASVIRHIIESICGMSWAGINQLLAEAAQIREKEPLEYCFMEQLTDNEEILNALRLIDHSNK